MRPESRLLLALCRATMSEDDATRLQAVVSEAGPSIDWGRFVADACRHGVVPLAGRNLARYGQVPADDGDLASHGWLLAAGYDANRARNQALFDEFARLFRALNHRKLRYAMRKGPALCVLVYDDPGVRRLSDLDLVIAAEDRGTAEEILLDLGYRRGRLRADGMTVTPVDGPADTVRNYPFLKPARGAAAPAFEVDLGDSALPRKVFPHTPAEDFLVRAAPVRFAGETALALAPQDLLTDLCAQVYKRANSSASVRRGEAYFLRGIIDVAAAFAVFGRDDALIERLAGRSAELGSAHIVFFAAHCADTLFPGTVPVAILDRLRPSDVGYLDEFGALDGSPERWRVPLMTRVFAD